MLLGCTSRLMHWLMLAANRLGSQARWHLSLREHLPQTQICKRSGLWDSSIGLHCLLGIKEEGFVALRPVAGPLITTFSYPRGLSASQLVSIAVKDRLGGSGINSQKERFGLDTKHSSS